MKNRILLVASTLFAAVFLDSCVSPNQRFQKVWYDGVRPGVRTPGSPGRTMADFTREFNAQLDLAERYGGPRIILIGDSNAEYAARRRIMRRFDTVAVNLGIGGTATDDWVGFFRSAAGAQILRRITMPGRLVVISLGGNDILQNRRKRTAANYAVLRSMLPQSLLVLIPAVHAEALRGATGRSPAELRADIERVNRSGTSLWGERVIDTATALRAPGSGSAAPGILRDAVHYSPAAFDLIIQTVNQYVKNSMRR